MTNRKYNSKWLFYAIAVGMVVLSWTVQSSMAAYLVDPSAYWQMEDTDPLNAGVVDDIASLTGTCVATECPTSGTGRVLNSLVFDGVNDKISFADNAVFDFDGSVGFSIEMWIKRNGQPAGEVAAIGRFFNPTSPAWWVGLNSDGFVTCDFWDGDGPYTSTKFSGKTDVTDNAWHHIVVVRDGANDQMMIYVDGVLDASSDQSGDDNTDGSFDSGADVTFAELNDVYQFAGELDGLAIYTSTVLSAQVIAQNHINGVNNKDLDDAFAPILAATASDTAAVGSTATISVFTAGNPAPTYDATALPEGATIDAATGVITWLPRDDQTGANAINITATNSEGPASQTLTITVDELCTSALNAYWKLNETDPATTGVVDETGIINGTCSGTECPTSAAGQIGNGFVFDGADDNVAFADSTAFDLDGTVGFSIEMWVKRNGNPGGDETFIGRFNATTAAWFVGLNASGQVIADFFDIDGDRTSTRFNGATDVTDNAWHHIVVVRDGVNDKMLIYVDGSLDASSDQSGDTLTDGSFNIDESVFLGEFNNLQQYAGELDEVAIYNKALSATTVAQHSTAGADLVICNQAPTFTSTEVTTAAQDVAYTYTATATDPETHTVTFSLTTAPTGMTIDANTGVISWTPVAGVLALEDVTILAADQYGATATQTFTITVALNAGPAVPVITSTAPTTATEEVAYTYDAEATDADAGDTLTWSITGAPTGMTLDAATGLISWTPAVGAAAAGDVTYTLTVTDGANNASQTVTVTVSDGSTPTPSPGGGGGGGGGCFISAVDF